MGAATALSADSSAEAGIVYSGPVDDYLDACVDGIWRFDSYTIDLPGGTTYDLRLVHAGYMNGQSPVGVARANSHYYPAMARVAGFKSGAFSYASNLAYGAYVSSKSGVPRLFLASGTMAYRGGFGKDQFLAPGNGYIGFSFDAGGGTQYGWVQVQMDPGAPHNAFWVVDYAYAGVGEKIFAGQTVPEPGSLGLLATGAIGLLLWRRKRRSSHPVACDNR